MRKKFIYVILPIAIVLITVISLNSFLNKELDDMLSKKELSSIDKEYGSIYKDKGVVFNEYVTQNNELVLQGSSELASPVSQLPTIFFPVKGLDTIVTNGRSYSQHLHQISILGSQQQVDMEGKKVALILSLQWFLDENGIDSGGFQANFSPVQFYEFLSNDKISKNNKNQYAKRICSLLTGNTQFGPERLYSKIYINDSFFYKIANIAFKPYFIVRKEMVKLKDKGLLYKKLRTLPQRKAIKSGAVDWNEEYKRAEEEGKSKVTNNEFMVYDYYYNNNLKNNVDSQKDANKNVDLMKSKEFEDYELYLDTCNELGIRPYIILMPTNGLWYDHIGIKKEERDNFYDKVQRMAEGRGFDVLNLKDEEYTPYFMCDVMHLGWKGWLKVDEELYKHFKE
ncbi:MULTISPECIES: D-alanyl-lipoteichoic acid biosynthesis protein DltD [unclassified Clostridium]|uniref:D-alanyl-lipoteichoic acid biosynthesis protein DltD n=1 Tax=unclassified Clostridium TaxID=2614128 RepID=UPI0013F0BCCC|nr:D-alanyl-lipoteichoic acid biosynthesis protein DltD [Clostridium botulinum]NFQ08886.1 D-alanyl-lipoteichoic acid biosynthesis protein DltD [Clostridium botulinum]